MEIIQKLIPAGRPNRPGYRMDPRWVTLHDTANTNKGADALAHARYLQATNKKASWHFTVDDQRVVQHLPLDESGYHAGDGDGPGNRQSIGIEICENADGDRAKAEERAIQLVVFLLNRFGIQLDAIVPHQHWSGKYCPHLLLPKWSEFIDRVFRALPKKPVKPWQPKREIEILHERDLIKQLHDPDAPVRWGEFATVMNRHIAQSIEGG